jgi:hypothetical protein
MEKQSGRTPTSLHSSVGGRHCFTSLHHLRSKFCKEERDFTSYAVPALGHVLGQLGLPVAASTHEDFGHRCRGICTFTF